jgi:hypothetical protein
MPNLSTSIKEDIYKNVVISICYIIVFLEFYLTIIKIKKDEEKMTYRFSKCATKCHTSIRFISKQRRFANLHDAEPSSCISSILR